MYRFILMVIAAVLLVGCGGTPDARAVAQQLIDAGLPIRNISDGPPLDQTTLPQTATSRVLFYIPQTAGGGQVFVCATSDGCAEYVGYFAKMRAPMPRSLVYQSTSGKVVVVIGADVAPTIAQNFQSAVAALP